MRKLSDISVSVKIPLEYDCGAVRRLRDGKWEPLPEDAEINHAHEEGRSWIEDHLPRPDAKHAKVEVEPYFVCSFCGRKWTEDDPNFNGCCCDKDMEHEPPAPAEKEGEDGPNG